MLIYWLSCVLDAPTAKVVRTRNKLSHVRSRDSEALIYV